VRVCPACANGDDHLCRSYDVLGRRRNGGYAELVAVPAANCLPYPDRLSWERAAAVPLVFMTAWHMLVDAGARAPRRRRARDRRGQRRGQRRAPGRTALRRARDRHAARPRSWTWPSRSAPTTASTIRARTWPRGARALTGKKGVDVVVEHVGGRMFEAAVAALARDGRLVTCGATTEAR